MSDTRCAKCGMLEPFARYWFVQKLDATLCASCRYEFSQWKRPFDGSDTDFLDNKKEPPNYQAYAKCAKCLALVPLASLQFNIELDGKALCDSCDSVFAQWEKTKSEETPFMDFLIPSDATRPKWTQDLGMPTNSCYICSASFGAWSNGWFIIEELSISGERVYRKICRKCHYNRPEEATCNFCKEKVGRWTTIADQIICLSCNDERNLSFEDCLVCSKPAPRDKMDEYKGLGGWLCSGCCSEYIIYLLEPHVIQVDKFATDHFERFLEARKMKICDGCGAVGASEHSDGRSLCTECKDKHWVSCRMCKAYYSIPRSIPSEHPVFDRVFTCAACRELSASKPYVDLLKEQSKAKEESRLETIVEAKLYPPTNVELAHAALDKALNGERGAYLRNVVDAILFLEKERDAILAALGKRD